MWHRYRFTLLIAVAIGAGTGVAIGLAIYLGGNADYRSFGGWGAFLRIVAIGGACGAGTALAASIVSMIALVIADRRLEKSLRHRKTAGGLGAAAGAAAFWLGLGVADGLSTAAGWQWFALTWVFVAVSAPIAALSAVVLIGRADR